MTELALPKIDKKTLDKKDYIFKSDSVGWWPLPGWGSSYNNGIDV